MIKRMWINQPSTLQDFHKYHGKRVLADFNTLYEGVVDVYFTDPGPVVSMRIPRIALSKGWG